MRPAGRFVAEVLSALIARVDVGVNLLELDELAHQMIRDRGAESCYINYHPSLNGWVSDSAISVIAGAPREQDQQLITTAEAALAAGIEAAVPGNKIGDISFAIARVGSQAGYKINTEFGGHGVGRTMHGDPH
ncbi:MAG: map, partial [Propionibacteriaceae bacterium]|nr:map [Propionibacteriaceae bacterium]